MAAGHPWWRAFTVRKKNTTSSADQQESGDFQPVGDNTSSATSTSTESQKVKSYKNGFEETEFEPTFNELTCRRNLKISRSGRFKEKRRVRAAIPDNNNFNDGNVAMAVVAK